jgi:protein-S-isoprenylcysteine O-methyltransferase Ste14
MDLTTAIFYFSLVAWFGLEVVRQVKDLKFVPVQREGDRGTLWLTTGFTLAGVAVGLWGAHAVPWYMPARTSMPVFVIGIGLMWVGMLLRIWAIRTLGQFFRSVVMIQRDHALVTRGPYRLLRHPSYAGALLTGVGAGVVVGNWFSLAAFVILPLIGYLRRIRIEEAALAEGLGEAYQHYAAASRRLVPFVW